MISIGLLPYVKKFFWPAALLYKMLDKSGLLMPIAFLVMVLPDMIGTYSFLVSQGLHPVIAGITMVGVQFGGQAIEIWNMLMLWPQATLVERVVFIGSTIVSVLRFLWFYYMFDWIADNLEPTVGNVSKWGVATGFLAMSTAFAYVIDTYALADGVNRISGTSYVIRNPELVLDPVRQFVGQQAGASAEALNRTVNNSTVGG